MGTKPAPPFANIFMAKNIDNKIRKVAEKYMENGEIPLKFMKRFLDDIFLNIPWDHNMKFTVIEKVKSDDPLYGTERKKLMIRKFNSFYSGINKEP